MLNYPPIVLSIAGHDPCGGAGQSADIKTFSRHGLMGMSVCTAITFQNEDHFEDLIWLSKKKIRKQLELILEKYRIDFVKIGIIENLDVLQWLVKYLKTYNKQIFILWDPVLKSSSGFTLHKKINSKKLHDILEDISLITPNWEEMEVLSGKREPREGAKYLSKYCSVYLKGGHAENKGVDFLWTDKTENAFTPEVVSLFAKHGSGCVFSAALLSSLAKGFSLQSSCVAAKKYIELYLNSTEGLLGLHPSP